MWSLKLGKMDESSPDILMYIFLHIYSSHVSVYKWNNRYWKIYQILFSPVGIFIKRIFLNNITRSNAQTYAAVEISFDVKGSIP